MLTAYDLEEDYAAVMKSETVLKGLFGSDWPTGLTLEDDAMDLYWHQREFIAKRSFAWVIRTEEEGYIGCAYLYPDIGTCGSGTAVYWMIDAPARAVWLADFGPLYLEWLRRLLPAHYDLSAVSNA